MAALFSLLVSLLLYSSSSSADPDPLQDFCVADLEASPSVNGFPCKTVSKVSSEDFFFDGLSKEGTHQTPLDGISPERMFLPFPALNTLGLSMNRVDLAPGGINPPHSHPRSTESGVVIQGTVLVGFVTTNNVFHSKVLSSGQMFVVPPGLVHFQLNIGKRKALMFTAFNSQLPGSVVLPLNLFAANPSIPNDVLTKTFQVEDSVINGIKSKFGF